MLDSSGAVLKQLLPRCGILTIECRLAKSSRAKDVSERRLTVRIPELRREAKSV
jgi:hypothetical protein